jgi:hypothetical protein
MEFLNRADVAGVEVDGVKVRDEILGTAHRRIVLTLEKNST